MANYCDYEIHARGSEKACHLLFSCQPVLDYKEIDFAGETDEGYVIHYTGCCKWSLDSYCEDEIEDSKIPNLDEMTLEQCKDEEDPLDLWYYTMRLKSEMFGLEIIARSWSEESGFDVVEHFKNGIPLDEEVLYEEDPGMYEDDYDEEYDEDYEGNEMLMPGEIDYEFAF